MRAVVAILMLSLVMGLWVVTQSGATVVPGTEEVRISAPADIRPVVQDAPRIETPPTQEEAVPLKVVEKVVSKNILDSFQTAPLPARTLTGFASDAELAKLNGVWVVVSCMEDGKDVGSKMQGRRMICRGTKVAWKEGDSVVQEEEECTFGENGQLTVSLTRGADKGKCEHCIYKVQKGALHICSMVSEKATDRPTDFTAKKDSKRRLVVLQPLVRSKLLRPITLVNTSTIRIHPLARNINPADVEAFELWQTRDGLEWKKHLEGFTNAPFVFEAQEEGVYGFTVVTRGKNGLTSKRPQPGDLAQQWVEVDLTEPKVRFIDCKRGVGEQSRTALLTWEASDKEVTSHLGTQVRVSLAFSEKANGPWRVIAEDLKNTGSYTWDMPPDCPNRVYFRLQASDSAGNMGGTQSREVVLLDPTPPEGDIFRIEPVRRAKTENDPLKGRGNQ